VSNGKEELIMSLIPWKWNQERGLTRGEDPFTALQQEVNRVFDSLWTGDDSFRSPMWAEHGGWMAPKLDVSETDKEVEVTVELPGMSEKDLDVELMEDRLKIHGEKKDERETKGHNFHRTERSFGTFERMIALPAKVKREGVQATFKNGILSVVLPKAEPSKVQQKITVQGA
jgi:HSP20 family protein